MYSGYSEIIIVIIHGVDLLLMSGSLGGKGRFSLRTGRVSSSQVLIGYHIDSAAMAGASMQLGP